MLVLLIAWMAIKNNVGGPRRDSASLAWTRDAKVPPTLAILPMLGGAALGFGLSAPAWLAILDYVHGSARECSRLTPTGNGLFRGALCRG